MAKRKTSEDVPGIFKKRRPASEQDFDDLWNQPSWETWFTELLGPAIAQQVTHDDPAAARDAQYAQHLHTWLTAKLATDPDAQKIVRNAYELGRLVLKLQILPLEPLVVTGRKITMAASRGAQTANQGRAEIYSQEAETYQAEVDALVADGFSYQAATEGVALSHGVSAKTVRRHTVNKSPQRRGRYSPE